MRSYQAHLQQTSVVQSQSLRKPVFRSSAIFPAFHNASMTTRLAFLGYWMIKRRIPEIHAIVTLRAQDGRMLSRQSELIHEPRSYRMELVDLLLAAGMPVDGDAIFTGSLEIEFYASRDLVYPYPAVVVNYYGPAFGTIVHTAQRVFNDAEDRGANQESHVPEAGFNLYADGDTEPFFAFVNGFDPVHNGSIAMKLYNHRAETMDLKLEIPLLSPYETTVVYPARHLDLQAFLAGQPGTAKISFDVAWAFPRMIAGNLQRSQEQLSVTHTYYDCSTSASDHDYWPSAPADYHPASLFVPIYAAEDRYTKVYFYPIYSPAEVEIDIEIYSAQGLLLGSIPHAHLITTNTEGFHTLDLKQLSASLGIETNQPLGANLIARPTPESRLPARIKIGLDYGRGADSLPCNICKTMEVCNPALEGKQSSFHWAPVAADQQDALLWVVNSCPRQAYDRQAQVTLTFYREQDQETLTRIVQVAPNGLYALRLSEDAALQDFLGGQLGWYTAVSPNPYVKSYYLSESASGLVGGDHDF